MWLRIPLLLALLTLPIVAVSQPSTMASQVAQEPRELAVLAGFGQDTVDMLAFFPQKIRVRAGDTVTWKQNSDASHNVAFYGSFPGPGSNNRFAVPGVLVPSPNLPVAGRPGVTELNSVSPYPYPGPEASGSTYRPGEFVSSGRMAGTPQTPGIDELFSFSLTFDAPGTYAYLCLVHTEQMPGTVEVVAASAASAPSQAEIDAQAQAEIAVLVGLAERAQVQRASLRSEPGPSNNTIWSVGAGNHWFQINDERSSLLEFLPKDLTVTSGDTVVWGSTGFHSVTFNPLPPAPPLRFIETLPDGTQVIINNPLVFDPVKPAAVYDPSQYYNSGNLSVGQPNGTAWTLAFDLPGTFEYFCGVHRELGMTGTITVLPR